MYRQLDASGSTLMFRFTVSVCGSVDSSGGIPRLSYARRRALENVAAGLCSGDMDGELRNRAAQIQSYAPSSRSSAANSKFRR